MNIAHFLTFTRLLVSPIFLIIFLEHEFLGISEVSLPYILLSLLIISELTDAMDGFLARRYNQVTDFGKIFDPMADSIARFTVFLTFTQDPVNLPIPLIFIFFYRDSVISTLRTVCALKGIALGARFSGKLKAVIQAIAAFLILLLMIPHSLGTLTTATLQKTSAIIVTIAAIYTVFSGVEYFIANRKILAKVLGNTPKH